MTISTAISLLSALIGSVATLAAAWRYLRSHHPPKGELLRTGVTVVIIMVGIFGIALLISNFTSIQINGQRDVPLPPIFAPHSTPSSSTPIPSSSPIAKPTTTSSPEPASKPTQISTPNPTSQPTQSSSSSTPSATPVASP